VTRFTKRFSYISFLVISFFLGWYTSNLFENGEYDNIEIAKTIRKPLAKYSIEELSKTKMESGVFEIKGGNIFNFTFSPDLGKTTKTTTGQINIPEGTGEFPLVVKKQSTR